MQNISIEELRQAVEQAREARQEFDTLCTRVTAMDEELKELRRKRDSVGTEYSATYDIVHALIHKELA